MLELRLEPLELVLGNGRLLWQGRVLEEDVVPDLGGQLGGLDAQRVLAVLRAAEGAALRRKEKVRNRKP